MANSVDSDQTAPIGAVCSGSTLFAIILNSSVMLGNYLQQTTLRVIRVTVIKGCSFLAIFSFFPLRLGFFVTNPEVFLIIAHGCSVSH